MEAGFDPVDDAVILTLRSGEVWTFCQTGAEAMTLEPSVWLEPDNPAPEGTQQIVLYGQVGAADAVVGWTLAKSQDTPLAIRDWDPA